MGKSLKPRKLQLQRLQISSAATLASQLGRRRHGIDGALQLLLAAMGCHREENPRGDWMGWWKGNKNTHIYIYHYTAGLELRMSAQFSKILWSELRMPAKWGILECRHMWHSKFQSWVRKPQYFPIFVAKTCHKQFIDWPEIYPKAFQVPSSTPSCMI